MATKKKNKVYLVQVGSELKSFDNWPACQAFVSGKPYKYAGGPTHEAALKKLRGNAQKNSWGGKERPADRPKNNIYVVEIAPGEYRDFDKWKPCQAFVQGKVVAYAGGVDREAAMKKLLATREWQLEKNKKGAAKTKAVGAVPTEGLTADAGTHGNPGPCEYQVTDIRGKVLAHKHLGVHTNNFAELAGIKGMIEVAAERGETILWTDSKIAMGWIKSKKLGPTVREPELIMELIYAINDLLKKYPQMELRKWETKSWGEIPSDFGRK